MKISARNQFSGIVKDVVIGTVNAEVHVGLKGGETIVASVTKDSNVSAAVEFACQYSVIYR